MDFVISYRMRDCTAVLATLCYTNRVVLIVDEVTEHAYGLFSCIMCYVKVTSDPMMGPYASADNPAETEEVKITCLERSFGSQCSLVLRAHRNANNKTRAYKCRNVARGIEQEKN